MAVNPSSLPQCETFANFDELRAETESLRSAVREIQEQNNELAKDRDLAEREVRRLRREADVLRRELQEVREADPKAKLIREVLDYWVKTLGKSSRTKCPPNGARWNKVRARMTDGFTVDQLKQAVNGCAKVPFVGPKGRQAEEGGGAKRHDDIELICRDETTVERFIAYGLPVALSKPQLSLVASAKLSLFERVVERLPDGGKHMDGGLMTACPCCAGSLFARTLARPSGELVLLDCYGNPPCDSQDVMIAGGLNAGDMVETTQVLNEFPAPFRLPAHLAQAMRQMLAAGVVEAVA